ncbi:TFIID-31kDa-domain-containing protein [Piedraia hortae CBS 480.64]|uniref:TFIID-31kDa-domain-containing protein n=1 Tax=Piedraia hortae CBS 480.64 TaxID=1314780 RepID=A0A6A7BQ38_9PEZI|nr:TFIID-31kDa-domain-containing protein [Piedraia hortae CBS 480.64]
MAPAPDELNHKSRDARILALVLKNYGVTSYQPRVLPQILDFAYRYTSGVLSDAQRIANEGYTSPKRSNNPAAVGAAGGTANSANGASGPTASGNDAKNIADAITLDSLRLAIAARAGAESRGSLPKDFMLEQARERNRLALPRINDGRKGLFAELPPEKFQLLTQSWNLNIDGDNMDVEGVDEDLNRNKVAHEEEDVVDAMDEDEEDGRVDADMTDA